MTDMTGYTVDAPAGADYSEVRVVHKGCGKAVTEFLVSDLQSVNKVVARHSMECPKHGKKDG